MFNYLLNVKPIYNIFKNNIKIFKYIINIIFLYKICYFNTGKINNSKINNYIIYFNLNFSLILFIYL